MSDEVTLAGSAVDACWLTLEEAADYLAVEPAWLAEHLAAGLIPDVVVEEARWAFSPATLARIRRIAWLEREFEAVPELAALVADLEEEIARLRARLSLLAP